MARQKIAKRRRFVIRTGSLDLKGRTDERRDSAKTFVNTIGDEVEKRFDEAERILDDVCKEAGLKLVPVAIDNLAAYHERLKQDVEEKAFRMQRYERVIDNLERHGRRFEWDDVPGDSRNDGQDS